MFERQNVAIAKGWTGRFFEDLAVGAVYQHPLVSRVVSDFTV